MIRLFLILLICITCTAMNTQETSVYASETDYSNCQSNPSASGNSEYDEFNIFTFQETTELDSNSE